MKISYTFFRVIYPSTVLILDTMRSLIFRDFKLLKLDLEKTFQKQNNSESQNLNKTKRFL